MEARLQRVEGRYPVDGQDELTVSDIIAAGGVLQPRDDLGAIARERLARLRPGFDVPAQSLCDRTEAVPIGS